MFPYGQNLSRMVKKFIRGDRMVLMVGELAFDLRRVHFITLASDTSLSSTY